MALAHVHTARRLQFAASSDGLLLSLSEECLGQQSLLDQLAAPESPQAFGFSSEEQALEQLVDQLPARQATALSERPSRMVSLRAAAAQLEISPMAVQRAQKKAIAALRHQLHL